MSSKSHKQHAPSRLKVGILTVSTTRTIESDTSGQWMKRQAEKEKHTVVCHRVVTDNINAIRRALCEIINEYGPQLIVLSGGTGLADKDVTIEAVRPLFRKELDRWWRNSVLSRLTPQPFFPGLRQALSVRPLSSVSPAVRMPASLYAEPLFSRKPDIWSNI